MRNDETVNVRYMVDDVDESLAFYTKVLGFEAAHERRTRVRRRQRGNLRLLLAGPTSSAGRPMPDGAKPEPGGWNRIHFIVDDLDAEVARLPATGATFRNDIVEGPGGKQILLQDPSGNVVELFQPAPRWTAPPGPMTSPSRASTPARVSLLTVAAQWGRIGTIGFGGPPAHIALFRDLCVERRQWFSTATSKADRGVQPAPGTGVDAARHLLGLAGRRHRRRDRRWHRLHRSRTGDHPRSRRPVPRGRTTDLGPRRRRGCRRRGRPRSRCAPAPNSSGRAWHKPARWRWVLYAILGGAAAATLGPWLVLVLLACGLTEIIISTFGHGTKLATHVWPALAATTAAATGGLLAVAWVAFKVGALSYGGGFVIIPLMQADAVNHYHWMTNAQFLDAVALGQVTPGPVVQTVAVVGYAAAGIAGGLLAAFVAFTPSFTFVLLGAPRFDRLRHDPHAPRVPQRRRPCRHRRDHRRRGPARARARRSLAVRGPRGRGRRALPAPTARRHHAHRRRHHRRDRSPARSSNSLGPTHANARSVRVVAKRSDDQPLTSPARNTHLRASCARLRACASMSSPSRSPRRMTRSAREPR